MTFLKVDSFPTLRTYVALHLNQLHIDIIKTAITAVNQGLQESQAEAVSLGLQYKSNGEESKTW